ncbi:MAG: chorismate synthase [Eubacteriales bacterium]
MKFLNAGESHGKCLVGIIEGFPSNVQINIKDINKELSRRQTGYGRGKRMEIEKDKIDILSGVRFGKTLGSPISFTIKNKDWENWKIPMAIDNIYHDESINLTQPRPGHADLPGVIKYRQEDIRNILERASARETASRTAIGMFCRQLLREFNIEIHSRVVNIGGIKDVDITEKGKNFWDEIEESELRVYDKDVESKIKKTIDNAKKEGDTLGGIVEISVSNIPVGLGSHTFYDKKIDGILAQHFMSLQAVKGVEIGDGFNCSYNKGSRVHDEIYYDNKYYRKSNHAGGIEGGITNGEELLLKAAIKPIPTLMKPLNTVDLKTKEKKEASKERSDVCAVPAAGVILENIAAWVITDEFLKKFGGDSLEEIKDNYNNYLSYIENL